MRENLEYDEEFAEDQEKGIIYILDWKNIFSYRNKCAVYKLKESDEQLKENILEGTSTHTNLYILLKEH